VETSTAVSFTGRTPTGEAGRLADVWGLLFCQFLLLDVLGVRAVANA
jgi:hypothetical protein